MTRKRWAYRMEDGTMMVVCYEGRLEGFMSYAELYEAMARWLKEAGR
jgi:hypothetical protein